MCNNEKQGWVHGNAVADDWAGAVIRKPFASLAMFLTDQQTDRPKRQGVVSASRKKTYKFWTVVDGRMDGWTDLPTNMAGCRVTCPRLKSIF